MTKGFFGLNASIYTVMALACLFWPSRVADELGLTIQDACGLAEVMAAFGAIPLAFALLFANALFRPADGPPTLRFALVVYGCFIAFRLVAAGSSSWTESGPARIALLVDVLMMAVASALYLGPRGSWPRDVGRHHKGTPGCPMCLEGVRDRAS